MNQILNLIRLIPNTGRGIALAVVIFGALFFIYRRFGWPSALAVGIGIAFIFIGLLIYKLLLKDKERREAKAFNKDLKAAQGASKEEMRDAVRAVSGKWEQAQADLQKGNIDLYELPWYMLIGEPQSGKSTTLKKSGLKFPVGEDSITGSGGTRNCDWWFTEEGVILDTAGRFTFQEQAATDAAEWNHFLKLLTRHRPLCPIHGVLLVIPVDSLLQDDPTVRHQKALNISDKLNNIQKEMGIQFPVFVLLTKADVIYGFTEFFNKLSPEQQREMFGWSNPEQNTGFDIPTFNTSFLSMIDRVDQVRKRNLSRPHYSDDAEKTFIFPEEFKALLEPLREYMSVIFEDSRYKDPLMFRGYYFSSGMQEGVPIAKACQNLIGDRSASKRLEQVFTRQRAFFIRDFYTEKVFPEQGLVQRAPKYAQRDRMKKRIVTIINAGLLLFGILFSVLTYWHLSRSLVKPMRAIDEALGAFEAVGRHFFDPAGDAFHRVKIYDSLHKLHSAIEEGKDINYLLVFRGSDNPLTRNMQNTFSYLYLDKIMTGVYQTAEQQLGTFSMHRPSSSSEENFKAMLAAFEELKRWRLAHARKDLNDLNPTIKPFLRLALDPAWEKQIAQDSTAGNVESLEIQFSSWFDDVYQDSSPNVRAFLVEQMVSRTDTIFQDLHEHILAFYLNQPEFKLYVDKVNAQNDLERAYEELRINSLGYNAYQETLKRYEATFQGLETLLENDADLYLSFDEIRRRTLESAGDTFLTVGSPDDQPSRAGNRLRDDLPKYVGFARNLNLVQLEEGQNPRGDTQGSLQLPEHLESFREKISQPYQQEFLEFSGTRYEDLPRQGIDSQANLNELFDLGANRGNLLTQIFLRNAQAHRSTDANPDRAFDLKDALEKHNIEERRLEGQLFLETLGRVVPADRLEVPAPTASSWRALVREFNQKTEDGEEMEPFLNGPLTIQDLFADYGDKWSALPLDSSEMNKAVRDYEREVFAKLKDFHEALNALNRTDPNQILESSSRSVSRFPQLKKIKDLEALDTETMPLLERHRLSLAAWVTAVENAFIAWRPAKPDPCAGCTRQIRQAKRVAENHLVKFPLDFTGNASQVDSSRGLIEYQIAMVPSEDLDIILNAIEAFRNPTPNQQEWLRFRGLSEWIQGAIAWADAIRQMRDGGISIQSLYVKTEELNTIAKEHTLYQVRGRYRSNRASLVTPRTTAITADIAADLENVFTEIRIWNDSQGKDNESFVRVQGDTMAFLGFALDDAVTDNKRQNFVRQFKFNLDFLDQDRSARFQFVFSRPIPPAPDWSQVR